MVTYEITAVVAPELIEKYEAYMSSTHIPEVLATGHFVSASFSKNENRYRIRYEAESQAALDEYLASQTERLRAEFLAHFPKGVELSRENWHVLSTYRPSDVN